MGLRNRLASFATSDQGADGRPTAYAIAKSAGVSTNTIYRLTNDPTASMSWEVLGKLCAALNCQPADLVVFEAEDQSV
jgi:DNA-binding Xre family transcriptional regulator